MKKRALALAMAVSMAATCLAACGAPASSGAASTAGSTATSGNEENSIFTEVGTYPVVKEGETLEVTAFAPLKGSLTTFEAPTNTYSQWLQDQTGVTLKFTSSADVDSKQKINTMMVSGEYPEVLIHSEISQLTPSEQLLYGEQGTLIPLNDLIENYMPNLKKILEENPAIEIGLTMSDGNIYSFPQRSETTHMITNQRMWINQTWLDNLGLEMPTTTEDFYAVLKAFDEKDANGNGDPNDEIPLTGSPTAWNTDPTIYLMNAFVPYSNSATTKGMYIEDGEVKYSRTQEEWKDGLSYINKLYSEGLIDPLTFTQTKADLQKTGNNPDANLIGCCTAGSLTAFLSIGESDRYLEYTTVPPLVGPDGFQQAETTAGWPIYSMNITDACENPEAIARMVDIMYSDEGFFRFLGEEGVDYAPVEEGATNYVGDPATIKLITSNADKGDRYWAVVGPNYGSTARELLYEGAPTDMGAILYREATAKYLEHQRDIEGIIPPFSATEDDARVMVDAEVALESYIGQNTIDFITGAKDIDSGWDKYLADIESYGLSNYLSVVSNYVL